MSAPCFWRVARQKHAQSPTSKPCKRKSVFDFSRKKTVKQDRRVSEQAPSASTPIMPNYTKQQSCINVSTNAKPKECLSTTPSISDSSANSEHTDSEATWPVALNWEPNTEPTTISSSTPPISTETEQQQLAMTRKRIPVSEMNEPEIYELPAPTEARFYVDQCFTTLEFDENGDPYFRISAGKINISSLPPKVQNAAYGHVLSKLEATDISKRHWADFDMKVLHHDHLHRSRLVFTRKAIRDLGLQYKASAMRSYRYQMSPWQSSDLRDKQMIADHKHLANAKRFFKMRREHEREERGILQLLDRCDQILHGGPSSGPADRRHVVAKAPRWKEGKKGWKGLQPDDVCLKSVGPRRGEYDDKVSRKARAKTVLKGVLDRAADIMAPRL